MTDNSSNDPDLIVPGPDGRIVLTVIGLSYSSIRTGAYALILAQENGPYRIPVVIGAAEAQSIALMMENIKPSRPMTHDLFVSFTHAFGVKLEEVFIYKFEDGIFSSELTFTDGERTVRIDSRTSDAIAIALRTGAPVYTTPEIVRETGFLMDEEDDDDGQAEGEDRTTGDSGPASGMINASQPRPTQRTPRPEQMTVEQLEKELRTLIDNEDYENAARISEILRRKKGE